MKHQLQGNHIETFNTPTFKKLVGKRVKYILKGESGIFPRGGVITEVYKKQIDFGSQEWVFLNTIKELIILD